MKKFLMIIAISILSTAAFAQSNKEDVDFIQSIYGKEKKAIVADFIKLEGAQKDAFWKLYDQYETERKELGKKRVALLEKYAAGYGTMNDADISKNIKETAALGVQTDKLIVSYHKKIEKAAGAKAAAQFFQIEAYFLSTIRAAILESIPFIGELD
jgi:Spy/CpxP family protein refolding chaperone